MKKHDPQPRRSIEAPADGMERETVPDGDGDAARLDVNAPEPDPAEHQGPIEEPGSDEDALEHGVE